MGVESVRRKTCLHGYNVPSTCLGIQEFFVSFCCLFWGLVKATQSNFPTRWSVDYHQRTSHTVFFVFSFQYAELVEKVQVNLYTLPQSQQGLASSHSCSPSLSTHLCLSCGTTESQPQTSRHQPDRFHLYLWATGTLLHHNFNIIMTPKNWTVTSKCYI